MDNELNVEHIVNKETYSQEEKAAIMQQLNEERLKAQQNKTISFSDEKEKSSLSEEEKRKILEKLNEHRLTQERYAKIREESTKEKQTYRFGSKIFYKLVGMEREYYIPVEICEKISGRPKIVTLYYQTLDALQKKDVLMKTESFSKAFFVSQDVLRVYYKAFALEKKRK